MGESGQDKITAFDTLFTNNHIQKLKILYSHLDKNAQKTFAVYIKFLELQYTLTFFRQTSSSHYEEQHNSPDIAALCEEIMPFCDIKEQEKLQSLKNILKNYENLQEMMQMLEIIKEIMPEGDPASSMDISSSMDMFSSMDLSSIMNLVSGMNSASFENIFQNMSDN